MRKKNGQIFKYAYLGVEFMLFVTIWHFDTKHAHFCFKDEFFFHLISKPINEIDVWVGGGEGEFEHSAFWRTDRLHLKWSRSFLMRLNDQSI